MLKKPLFIEMIVLILIVGTLHFAATIYHLYWSIYELDSLIHFFASAAAAIFFLWLYFFSGYFSPPKRNLNLFLLVSFLGAVFLGISWEIYELIFEQTMVEKADYPYDLTMDLIMDLLGILAGCFYGYLKEENIRKKNNSAPNSFS